MSKPRSAFLKYWQSRLFVLTTILDGLQGKPFSWGTQGATNSYKAIAKELGITLITKTQVQKQGLLFRRGVEPVGRIYFGSPISKMCDVYVKECQTIGKSSLKD